MNKYLREYALQKAEESFDKQGRLRKDMQEFLLNFFAKITYKKCTTCNKRMNCPTDPDPFSHNKACDKYMFDKLLLRK